MFPKGMMKIAYYCMEENRFELQRWSLEFFFLNKYLGLESEA
jgi:hypothetical protein